MHGPKLRSGKLEWEVSVGRWGGRVFALIVVHPLVVGSQGFFECPPGLEAAPGVAKSQAARLSGDLCMVLYK